MRPGQPPHALGRQGVRQVPAPKSLLADDPLNGPAADQIERPDPGELPAQRLRYHGREPRERGVFRVVLEIQDHDAPLRGIRPGRANQIEHRNQNGREENEAPKHDRLSPKEE